MDNGEDYDILLKCFEDAENEVIKQDCPMRYNHFSSENEVQSTIKNSVPKSTFSKDKWAIKIFSEYNYHRNQSILSSGSEELMVLNEISEMSKSDLSFLLPKFIHDVRKRDGSKYPGESLRQLVCAIFHYFRYVLDRPWDFFRDEDFIVSRKALDACMKIATKEGVGLYKRKADFISHELEEKLWDRKALGTDNPRHLLSTLIYMFGIHFGLRARKEHRQLRAGGNSQLKLMVDATTGDVFLRYTEDCQKTKNGGLYERNIAPKVIDVYEKENERNIVKIYRKYMAVRPTNGKNIENFYLQPSKEMKGNVWYKDQPLGENAIGNVIKNVFEEADIGGHFTNHSLRRTKVTRLFQAGIDKESVKTQTGHRSDAGVMAYREVSVSEKKVFQNIIEKSSANASVTLNQSNTSVTSENESIVIEVKHGEKSVRITM